MSINKINISIEDNKRFGLIAFLVDRSDFLTDIREVRNLLELRSFPYTFPNFSYKKANNVVNYYKQGICNIYDVYSVFKDICKEENIFPAELDKTLASAFVLTKSLTKKYCKSGVYIPVILSSILVGEVKEGDILPTNTFEIGKQNIEELDERFKDNRKSMSIVINHESTWEEVKNAFTHIQKYKFGSKKIKGKNEDVFYKIYNEGLIYKDLPDTVTNIKRDRDWYWQKKSGMSYEEIRKKTKKVDRPATWQAVRNSIYRYKSHLD